MVGDVLLSKVQVGPALGIGWGGFIMDHFAGVVGIPMAALTAFCIVILLQSTSGPIKFKILKLEFEGASGQVILWVFCFLAIVLSIKLLW